MATPYFGGAPNAFMGGMEFATDRRRRLQQDNALNAMIERFGPEAANPQALATLQGAQQSQQLFPHQLGAAQRATAAQNELVQRHGAIAGDPAAHAIQQTETANVRTAGLNLARLLQTTKAKKGDLGAAFDRGLPVLQALGLPVEQLGNIRQQLIDNPDFVDEFASLLTDPNKRQAYMGAPIAVYDQQGRARLYDHSTGQLIEGVTPAATVQGEARLAQGAERLGLGWSTLSWDQVKRLLPSAQPGVQYYMGPNGQVVADFTPGSPQEFEHETTLGEMDSADRARVRVATGMREAASTVVTHGGRALERMRDPSWIQRHGVLSANARRAAAAVPGTAMFELERDIQSVKDNIGINELLRIKESGSGLGHVPQSQLETLQSVLGRLEITRDPQALVADLSNALRIFEQIVQAQEQEVQEARRSTQQRRSSTRSTPSTSSSAGEPSLDDLLKQYGQ